MVDHTEEKVITPEEFLKEIREFSLTMNEECPEGHRKDPASGRCLPLGSYDHTKDSRSLNVDYGPEWRGTASAENQETALLDANEMDEPESCSEGTTFSFIQRKCIPLEEADAEDNEEFARDEEGNPIEEEVEDAAAPGQGGHEEITMMQPEGRRDTVNHECPANMFFDYKLRKCIPLNKDSIMASEDFDDEFKKAVAMWARVAMTTSDPMDGHKHVATLDEDGNGTTSVAGWGDSMHSHSVKKFVVQDASAGDKTSKHPGVAVPEEHEIEKPEHYGSTPMPASAEEEEETAAKITTKQRKGLPDSAFGVPGKRKFPLDTCGRVRNAMARFNQAKGLTSGEKATLRRKIMARAKACGIEVRRFAKATTEAEFAEITADLIRQVVVPKTQADEGRLDAYRAESQGRGPCPPGMMWDKKSKKCAKMAGFVTSLQDDANHSEIIAKDPAGRKDTVGFQCPDGWFFDFGVRRCLPLDPAAKEKALEEDAVNAKPQNRDLAPRPKGKPARLPQDCPKGEIWDADLEKCKPLDSRKKTKSEEEDAQKEKNGPANGPGKNKDSKGCGPGEFFNPVTKKCMPRKGAFKGKSGEEDAQAAPGNREGLTKPPAGKVQHPTDCPPNTAWDAKNKICRPIDSMDKDRPSGSSPQAPRSVASLSTGQLIQQLDKMLREQADSKEKSRVAAKDLPNAAFPPSLVSETRRAFMHHTPDVEDPYDHNTVDAGRLRNALARSMTASASEGFQAQAFQDGVNHLLYHARALVEASTSKKGFKVGREYAQLTDSETFHPLCQPQEVFDPKSGSCIPITNVRGEEPAGTLECPEGYVLDEKLNMCVPADAFTQAGEDSEKAAPFRPTGKMERCIRDVKAQLAKSKKGMDPAAMKSSAIAICRSRLKASLEQEVAFHMPPEDRERLARALYHFVADCFVMAVKGYNFHWNVVAPIFEDLHAMFGADYETLLGNADCVAERIRALGFSTPGSLSQFSMASSISDQEQPLDWRMMVEEWISDHIHMGEDARALQKIAEEVGDNNTLAMLDSIILCHDKRAWMFRSLIGSGPDRFPS